MKIKTLQFTLAFFVSTFAATAAFAEKTSDRAPSTTQGKLVPAKEAPADWLANAQAAYPTTQCVVSEDKLGGEMGGPVDYVYKAEGKPDRLVRFCCKDCVKDFKKDPEKYLSEIDKAAAKKGDPAKGTAHAH